MPTLAETNVDSSARLFDVKQVACLLRVSVRTVYRLMDSDRLPRPLRIGGRSLLRWRQCEIEEWVEAGCPDLRGGGSR